MSRPPETPSPTPQVRVKKYNWRSGEDEYTTVDVETWLYDILSEGRGPAKIEDRVQGLIEFIPRLCHKLAAAGVLGIPDLIGAVDVDDVLPV